MSSGEAEVVKLLAWKKAVRDDLCVVSKILYGRRGVECSSPTLLHDKCLPCSNHLQESDMMILMAMRRNLSRKPLGPIWSRAGTGTIGNLTKVLCIPAPLHKH